VTPASRARLLAGVGRLGEAEDAVRAGLIEAPADPELLALLAGLLRLQNRHDDALAAADAAVAAGPHLAGTHIERAECLLVPPGKRAPGDARTAEALAEAEEAVRLDPAHPPAHRVLARALTLRRDFDRARDSAHRALALAPGSVADLLTLAELERHAGRRDAARDAARQALAHDPENPDGRWLIALLEAERLRVRAAMRGLRGLAADHPARLDAMVMTWPIRGLLGGLRRGLAAGLLLTGVLAAVAAFWPSALLPARAAAVTVAAVMVLFSARVLVPAGRLPWRCLTLLPARTRRATHAGWVAAGTTIALLLAYAVTARPQALVLCAVSLALMLLAGRADRL
jgi:tetratricopeptide (TPR) repeat protein